MDKKRKKIIIIAIVILLILLVVIVLIRNNVVKNEQNQNTVGLDTRTEEQKNEDLIKELKQDSESERIRTYLGTYFKHIENKEYEKAYNLLYPDFRKNYFPKLEDFQKYIEEQKYPALIAVSYDDIFMQGEYYVVEVTLTDFLGKTLTFNVTQKYIVQEDDYNEYYISFQK